MMSVNEASGKMFDSAMSRGVKLTEGVCEWPAEYIYDMLPCSDYSSLWLCATKNGVN